MKINFTPSVRDGKLVVKRTVEAGAPAEAVAFLAQVSGLSKAAVKDAMIKGAAWLRRQAKPGVKNSLRRLRRATTALKPGDYLELYYDAQVLARDCPAGRLLEDKGGYSVWYKPAGLMAQGSQFGDHCALLRHVEKALGPQRPVFLVHRLDREAAGLMVFAHSRKAAGALSALFAGTTVDKRYRVQVMGDLAETHGRSGRIEQPLDGKAAVTEYTVTVYDPHRNLSTVEVRIFTGRLHQIRRHLEALGHPVYGDPRYGRGNKNTEGMKLVARALCFDDPATGRRQCFGLDEGEVGF